MPFFNFGRNELSREEQYGNAWLLIVGQTKQQQGLKILKDLDAQGYDEAAVALAMFSSSQEERKRLIKKAAEKGNPEAMWEYTAFLPHSFYPNESNPNDKAWIDQCIRAAENGSVDAMNESGNIFSRRSNYLEAMYWYAMANAHGHPDGQISLAGIAKKWVAAGSPSVKQQESSPSFDDARCRCALAYLEINSGKQLSVPLDEIIRYVLNGTPIAAYLAGDIFEGIGNFEMAYKMYNAISFENDAHGLKCYADMLYFGRGIESDVTSAKRFYQLSAEKGDRESMFIMGEFTKGSNRNLAAYWYGLSHTRGYSNSLDRLVQLAE